MRDPGLNVDDIYHGGDYKDNDNIVKFTNNISWARSRGQVALTVAGMKRREGGGTMLEKTFPSIQRYQD